MYTGLKHLHSGLAYLVLAGLAFSFIYTLTGYLSKQPFTDKNRKMALIGFITMHLQLLAGLLIYLVSPLGVGNVSGETMKEPLARLYAVEHPLTMLIAVVLVTLGYTGLKKLTDSNKKFKRILVFYGIGLLLILIRIPWQVWPN